MGETKSEPKANPRTSSDPEIACGSSTALDEGWHGGLLSIAKRGLGLKLQSHNGRWSNEDLDPTPPDQQKWTTLNYIFYWINDATGPGNLRLGSSLYTVGLSWKLVLVIIAMGHFLMTIGLTLNGVVGARFHIPYSVQARAPFGFFFSFVVVVVRMIVAGFWYGINTYTGAQCVRALLLAIWPSFAYVSNRLPTSSNITTQMMLCYIIYFVIAMPFHWIHPRNLRWFFIIKSVLSMAGVMGMLIWACTTTGNGLDNAVFHRGSTIGGSELGWAFMAGLNAMLGNYGTIAVNINDFTRYAKRPHVTYIQLFVIPASFVLMALIGLIIVGSAEKVYGSLQWDVLSILTLWNGSSGARAGAAFAALSMMIGQIGTNLGANCVSAANDLNAMFPKYIDLRRGSYLVAFFGAWALTPWNVLASANSLLNFMDGYAIWLAPITGILLADFWIIHGRYYDSCSLYHPEGQYRYNKIGTNWRAVVAWVLGWVPLLPGLAHATTPSISISNGARNFYKLGYLYGLSCSFIVYTAMSTLWKPKKARAV